ncbi:hypothetical protein PsorP6_015456 [Peronosclerospora sorghi]|uniref:Uncharacterized protein n=1 Tax=Peronosclerospora sorghi TaxID=230839 RepID=A0ACC0WPP3_9STRA|nr:hypothetical protein PsorP6_015456 [Peronosclerospora sorghi]
MTARDEYRERHSHVVTEMGSLLQELKKERRRTSEIKHPSESLTQVKRELCSLLSKHSAVPSQSVARLAGEAIDALKTEFKTEFKTTTSAMQQRWKEQARS